MFSERKKYRSGEKTLTPSQVEKLIEHITDLEDMALIQLALSTGIRREDIVKIKSRDIDLNRNTVTFYEHKKRRTRTIPLQGRCVNTLAMWLKINRSPYLFPSRHSGKKHMSGKTAYNIFNRCLKRAGLEKRPFHALRATTVKLCQKAGWSPEQTAEFIGDRVTTIQLHYSVPTPEEMKELAEQKPIL
jgi:integrase